MTTLYRFSTRLQKVAATAALVGGMAPLAASALTLDTTFLQANSVFALNDMAYDAMKLSGTTISALGNASLVGGAAAADPSTVPSFNLPVTKVDVSLGLPFFGPMVTPNSGAASGSALLISRGQKNITLANFVIDYKSSLVMADITANGVTQKYTSLYSFEAPDLQIGLNGLTLNMHQQLSNLVLTPTALSSFSSGLNLSKFFQNTINGLDFGTITVDINGALRFGLSDKAFVASSVPEAPSMAAMALGLVGIAAVSRRKAASQG